MQSFSVGVVALAKKKVILAVVLKEERVARLARVPAAGRSIRSEWLIRQPLEMYAVVTDGHAKYDGDATGVLHGFSNHDGEQTSCTCLTIVLRCHLIRIMAHSAIGRY